MPLRTTTEFSFDAMRSWYRERDALDFVVESRMLHSRGYDGRSHVLATASVPIRAKHSSN